MLWTMLCITRYLCGVVEAVTRLLQHVVMQAVAAAASAKHTDLKSVVEAEEVEPRGHVLQRSASHARQRYAQEQRGMRRSSANGMRRSSANGMRRSSANGMRRSSAAQQPRRRSS